MHHSAPMDKWLRERLVKYEKWLEQGRIPFSSKVIPISRSLPATPTIMPSSQVLEYLRQARSIALSACACRSYYRRCDNPTDVCLYLDQTADRLVKKGEARPVSFDTAAERLTLADTHGLVHLTLHDPHQYPFAICSCCPCCCHDLQYLLKHNRTDLVVRSDFVAMPDSEACVECGACADRCVFGARTIVDEVLTYDPDQCYGCGLCVTTCPTQAIRLEANTAPTL